MTAVLQDWVVELPFQQQSVLMSSLRGPDGMAKHHSAKTVIRAYRASVLKASTTGQPLGSNEVGDSFMDIRAMYDVKVTERFDLALWDDHVQEYFHNVDNMPHHYHLHMLHSAQIAGVHHSDDFIRAVWWQFYITGVNDMHLVHEAPYEMNYRLNDSGNSPGGKCGYPIEDEVFDLCNSCGHLMKMHLSRCGEYGACPQIGCGCRNTNP